MTEHDLEEEWDLDDAQDEIIEHPEKRTVRDVGEIEEAFLCNHPPPECVKDARTRKLPLPGRTPATKTKRSFPRFNWSLRAHA